MKNYSPILAIVILNVDGLVAEGLPPILALTILNANGTVAEELRPILALVILNFDVAIADFTEHIIFSTPGIVIELNFFVFQTNPAEDFSFLFCWCLQHLPTRTS